MLPQMPLIFCCRHSHIFDIAMAFMMNVIIEAVMDLITTNISDLISSCIIGHWMHILLPLCWLSWKCNDYIDTIFPSPSPPLTIKNANIMLIVHLNQVCYLIVWITCSLGLYWYYLYTKLVATHSVLKSVASFYA